MENYHFRGQREDEQAMLVVKQNPWTMAKAGYIDLVIAIIVVVCLVLFGASRVTSMVMFLGIIIVGAASFYYWFIWWNGIYILTNQRIIKIDQQSLFHRLISEAELDRIQDITTETKGPIQTALNFGTVHIQTASAQTVIDLPNVTNPYDLQQKIVKAHKVAKGELPGQVEISDTFEQKAATKVHL